LYASEDDGGFDLVCDDERQQIDAVGVVSTHGKVNQER
jgi:hypothetical protein